MEKKLVVNVLYGLRSVDMRDRMRHLASCLYREHDIPIKMDEVKFYLETPNVIVRFVNTPEKLLGLKADEIFGGLPEDRKYRRKLFDTKPYAGTILEYILEVERGTAKEGVDIHGI